jgi:hypothetical protein
MFCICQSSIILAFINIEKYILSKNIYLFISLCKQRENYCGSECTLPNVGIDEAVGGAVSTKMSNRSMKLENVLIAAKKHMVHISFLCNTF